MLFRTLLFVAVLIGTPAVHSRPSPVLVSAAISLSDALQEIAAVYERERGASIRFNFAGSNVLARQIVNGAPADLFISADGVQMEYAFARGAIAATPPRRPLLGNRLAVVTPRGHGRDFPDVKSLTHARRIAIGDPAAVPAGVYARQYLERTGIWASVQGKLLPLANVRAALAAAQSGGADAALVYESDAVSSKKVDLAFIVRGQDAPRITYPAGIVAQSRNRDSAREFLEFLHGSTAGAIFKRYGFLHGADLGVNGDSHE